MRRFHGVVVLMILLMGGSFLSFEKDLFMLGLILGALFFILPLVHFIHESMNRPGGSG